MAGILDGMFNGGLAPQPQAGGILGNIQVYRPGIYADPMQRDMQRQGAVMQAAQQQANDPYIRAMEIMQANQSKPFVQRILQPDNYPSLDLGNGQRATHLMAWGDMDGKHVVYPTVQMDGNGLKDYGDAAFDRAIKSGDYITFPTAEEADWFSRNYKAAWGGKRDNQP